MADIGVISCYITIAAILFFLIVLIITRCICTCMFTIKCYSNSRLCLNRLRSDKISRQCQVKFSVGVAFLCVAVMYILSVWPNWAEFLNNAACKAVASLLHYFLTALFLWLAADAYVALTTYGYSANSSDGSRKGDKFFMNASIVCWGN